MADSPFKLLEPYGAHEKDSFFGRDAEIIALYHLLKQSRLVLIYGGSGTGKTSLIQAGLPKVLKVADWFRIAVRRKENINISLRQVLAHYLKEEPISNDLSEDLYHLFEKRWIPIYLVFDQFEELFTLGNDHERKVFFISLQQIIEANIPCKIILSMREEYIGHLYDYEPFVPSLFEKRFRLEPMKDVAVTKVIENTCAFLHIGLEEGRQTAQHILEQVKQSKQAAYLPYLQIYLHYLYIQGVGDPIFKKEDIEAVGALGNVLKKFINEKTNEAQIYLDSFDVNTNFAQQLLDEFATGEGTKQSRTIAELSYSLSTNQKIVTRALIYFSDRAKLLRADENEVDRYEPVHDVVAKQIYALRSTEDREFKAFQRHIGLAYNRWIDDERAKGRLLPELDLSKVSIYRERLKKLETYQKWQLFISQSTQHHFDKRKWKRIRNSILIVITLLAIGASILAYIQKTKADAAKKKAIEKTEIAEKALKVAKDEKAEKEKQRIKAEENAQLALKATKTAEMERDKSNAAEIKTRTALAELEKKNIEVIKLIIANAKHDVLNLRYESALEEIKAAASLGTLKEEVAKVYLEIAFWYSESGDTKRAVKILKSIEQFMEIETISTKLSDFPDDFASAREQLRNTMKILDRTYFNFLFEKKYYPEMVDVEGGIFDMGCDSRIDPNCESKETLHKQEISSFQLAKYETTVWQFALFCAATQEYNINDFLVPNWDDSGNDPVVNVNWYQAVEYTNWINRQKMLNSYYFVNNEIRDSLNLNEFDNLKWIVLINKEKSNSFRLPTEAEWEYAAKGGKYKNEYIYSGGYDIDNIAWYRGAGGDRTHSVGSKRPNVLGLYDLSGNVWEWCWDWYDDYPEQSQDEYKGPNLGSYRVLRGGAWNSASFYLRCAKRNFVVPNYRQNNYGFRICRAIN